MLLSFSAVNRVAYVLCSPYSIFQRFKGSLSHSSKNVIKLIPVTSRTAFLLSGCCFSKSSSNKPSFLSRIKNRKYTSVDLYAQEVNGNSSLQNEESTKSTTECNVMKRSSSDNVSTEQYATNELSDRSDTHDNKRVKRDYEQASDTTTSPSRQIPDVVCSNLKETVSLENLFSEEKYSAATSKCAVLSIEPEFHPNEVEEESFSKDINTQKSLKEERKKQRPNYFVAVQISDSQIHKTLKELQEHILEQDERLQPSLILLPTLHITLMVMHINDNSMHMRALKALQNVNEEYNDIMSSNPLCLTFKGLGHFQNRVLFVKLSMDDAYLRLCTLAESVKKHFAAESIFSTDTKELFTPHLTIAKLNFRKKSQKNIKKIKPSLYSAYEDQYFGQQTIKSIQLLRMTGPKDESGYYGGDELFFSAFHPDHRLETLNSALDTEKKKKEIKEKIHLLTKQAFID